MSAPGAGQGPGVRSPVLMAATAQAASTRATVSMTQNVIQLRGDVIAGLVTAETGNKAVISCDNRGHIPI